MAKQLSSEEIAVERAQVLVHELQTNPNLDPSDKITLLKNICNLLGMHNAAEQLQKFKPNTIMEDELRYLEADIKALEAEKRRRLAKVIILTGHSGAGKDTVSEVLRNVTGFASITPHATRAMRKNEVEGNPYYFISVDRFFDMVANEEFLETASYITEFNGNKDTAYYGTAVSSIPNDRTSVVTIGVNAAKVLKERLGDRGVLVYLHVDDSIREERAKARGSFDQIEWDNRLAQDHKRFGGEIPEGMDVVVDNMQAIEETIKEVLDYAKH